MSTIPLEIEVKETNTDETRKKLDALEKEIKEVGEASKKTGNEIEDAKKKTEAFNKAADKGAKDLKGMGSGLKGVGSNLSAVNPQLANFTNGLSSATSGVQGLISAFGPWGLVVGGAVVAVGALVNSLREVPSTVESSQRALQGFRDTVLDTVQAIEAQIEAEKEFLEIARGRDGMQRSARLVVEAQEEIFRRQTAIRQAEEQVNNLRRSGLIHLIGGGRQLEEQLQLVQARNAAEERLLAQLRRERAEGLRIAEDRHRTELKVAAALREQHKQQILFNQAALEGESIKSKQAAGARRSGGSRSNTEERRQQAMDRLVQAADRLNNSLEEQERTEQRINDLRDLEITRAQIRAENQRLENERAAELLRIEEERINMEKDWAHGEAQFRAQALIDEEQRNKLVQRRNQATQIGANYAKEAVSIGRDLAHLSQEAARLAEQEGITKKEAMATVLEAWLKTFAIEQAFEGAGNTIQAIAAYARQDYSGGTQFLAAAAGNFALAAAAGGAAAAIPTPSVGAASNAPQQAESPADSQPTELTVNVMGRSLSTEQDIGRQVRQALEAERRRR